jgi:hypothetical protein
MTKSQQTLHAERKLAEILGAIHYDTTSLTHALVKAFRNGMDPHGGQKAHDALQIAISEMFIAFQTAVAQPENKTAVRPQVSL